jgi:D-alanine-D-alanine ligase
MRRLRVALIYNAYDESKALPDDDDQSNFACLRDMIFRMARAVRRLGHKVTVVPLTDDLNYLQRRLRRLKPHVVLNQYDDVVHGAAYEMRVAAFIRMMGIPITGSPALALGLSRYKFMAASLLQGAGVPIPAETSLIERIGEINGRDWSFPLIVHTSQEHAGIGMDRHSVVTSKAALKDKVREILFTYHQPALVQKFLPGREFNVGLIGGKKLRVMPLAEVDYSSLPEAIPPIMSYAAKWIESSVEFKNTRIICPAKTTPELAQAIADVAKKAFRVVGGWGYGRVDIRLGADGRPRVLEVNCNPCLDNDMGLARAAKRAGLNYSALLQVILQAAFEGPPFDMNLPIFGLQKSIKPNGN